jgi:AraC family transcriptional regulator
MFVGIEKKPGFEAVGMKYRGKNEKNEVPELWESFVPRMGEVVEVASSEELPQGMVSVKVPDQTYAAFKAALPKVKEAFGQIYGEWFPGSGYKRTPGPEFEFYGEEFGVDQTIYIYIPVQVD